MEIINFVKKYLDGSKDRMPLEREKSSQNYVRVSKLFLSSKDRNVNSFGPYDYFIDLDEDIQYVVGMEITGYNFPSEISPTFVAEGTKSPGTNKLDFQLEAGAISKTFTATWPEKQYNYQNVTVPYLSYVLVLAQIMNLAIETDPDFGVGAPNQATFASTPDPEERTHVTVTGAGVTGFAFLFDSGPNEANSAFNAMGYAKTDTVVALDQVSPTRTNLRPFRFIDINLDQAREFTPLKRVYTTDNIYYGTVRNDPNITRTRLLSSQPLRKMQRINVKITLEGGVIPPTTIGLDHDLTVTVFSVANETSVPSWVKQVFVL